VDHGKKTGEKKTYEDAKNYVPFCRKKKSGASRWSKKRQRVRPKSERGEKKKALPGSKVRSREIGSGQKQKKVVRKEGQTVDDYHAFVGTTRGERCKFESRE